MTHVPLWRPAGVDCGPERRGGGGLRYMQRLTFQTMLGPEVRERLGWSGSGGGGGGMRQAWREYTDTDVVEWLVLYLS